MIALNLTTANDSEIRIKEYLEKNASETLAEKINNGVLIALRVLIIGLKLQLSTTSICLIAISLPVKR